MLTLFLLSHGQTAASLGPIPSDDFVDQFDRALETVKPIADEVFKRKFNVAVAMHWTMPPQNLWLNRAVANLDEIKQTKKMHDLKKHPGLHNKSGRIGFLGHGSVVEFRNIRIKEL